MSDTDNNIEEKIKAAGKKQVQNLADMVMAQNAYVENIDDPDPSSAGDANGHRRAHKDRAKSLKYGDVSGNADAGRQKKGDGSKNAEAGKRNVEGPSLREVINEQAIEGEARDSRYFSLTKILGGDILTTAAVRRQIWVLVIITAFLFVYISNRYSCQKDLIEIDRLEDELTDAKYKALSSSSKLTEMSRESHVLQALQADKDSTLKTPTQPPFIVEIPQ